MGRTVTDVALLLSALAGPDHRVPIARPEPGSTFAPPLDADVMGTRIAWAPACGAEMPVEPEVVALIDGARPTFEALGCPTEEAFPNLAGAREAFFTLRAQMFAASLGPLLELHRDRMKATVVWNIEQGLGLTGADIARAAAHRAAIDERIAAFFERFDAIAMPVSQVPPFPVEQEFPTEVAGSSMHTYLDWMESCWAITITGLPAISVPCGFTGDGLPVGIQLVGRRWDDLGLLRLAHAFEQATKVGDRRPSITA
jgi:amidase